MNCEGLDSVQGLTGMQYLNTFVIFIFPNNAHTSYTAVTELCGTRNHPGFELKCLQYMCSVRTR